MVRQKITTAVKGIQKQGKLTQQLKCAFAAAQTKAEVEQLVCSRFTAPPYKYNIILLCIMPPYVITPETLVTTHLTVHDYT